MFIPLHDANPLRHIHGQFVTIGLIVANGLVYLLFQTAAARETVIAYSLIPVTFNGADIRPDQFAAIPESLTLLSYAFLHADFWHLAGNMVFLWVFGDNVEDAVGHWKFLAFYCLSAVGAGWVHTLVMADSPSPLVGSSGAVSGVVAGYLILHPRVKIWVLALGRIPLRLSAAWVLGFWIVMQIVNVTMMVDEEVAWWAHIGGLATGALLIFFLRRPGVPLFDRGLQPGPGTPAI